MRTCTVCSNPRRSEIDEALVNGTSLRSVAKSFGISLTAAFRHKQDHLPVKLMKAHDAQEVLAADNLLGELSDLRNRLRNGLVAAEASGSGAAIVSFAREYRATLESFFDITERIAARSGANGGPVLAVTVERIGLPDRCPHCDKPLEHVVKEGLG